MARRRPTEPTVNPARGAVLVVVAVLVGLLLLRNGLDTSEVVTSTRDDSSADDSGDEAAVDDEGTDDTDTTEETVPAKTPAEVSVIVFNASSTNGAGGKYTTALQTAGYVTLEPATAEVKVPTSQVLFTPGFEREAAAVAAAIGAPALTPAALDPAAPPGDVGTANVVVVLGSDLAPLDPVAATTTTPG
jgi:hypothetical protein